MSYTAREQTLLLEQFAEASLARRGVERRSLWMELSERCSADELERPRFENPVLLALAAASAEMLAQEQGCEPPQWAAGVGKAPEPVYLDHRATAKGLERMREQSPLPLRKRGFYAPAKYCQLT